MMKLSPQCAAFTLLAMAISGPAVLAAGDYEHSFQNKVGGRATFNVSGPATGANPDVQGDAFLDSVVYPNGDAFTYHHKPSNIFGIDFNGDASDRDWCVRGGAASTIGLRGDFVFGLADGDDRDVSDLDMLSFRADMLRAFNSNNLNNDLDMKGCDTRFTFTIEFDLIVRDNDPGADDFGEILYFERGAGAGDSWIKFQAVDEDGNALGPWLVISPSETVPTEPVTTVHRDDERLGACAIDVSRLGVSEFRFLRVSNDCADERAYSGGGDLSPDFKVMVIVANKDRAGASLARN